MLNPMIAGGSSWAETDVFDIEAKAEDPATATSQQMLVRLQALLADRFKLKFHKESKEVSGYELLVAANGPKLKEADPAGPQSFSAAPLVKGQRMPVLTIASFLGLRLGRPAVRPAGDQAGPSLMTALQEQLGLRLHPQRIHVDVVVIDSVEKPSVN
jgi:uncharacterized protein (TIGR03435 family)